MLTDIVGVLGHVRKVPETRKSMTVRSTRRPASALRSLALLLDQLIRAQQYRCRDVDLQRLGGLKIDRQFEFGRLFDG